MKYFKSFLKDDILLHIVLIISVLAGFFFRLKGLGTWPLAIDEYYIVKSVENILRTGIPEWPAGGFYLRGLIFQYLIAMLLAVGIKTEFAARIIPVFINLLAVPPLYMLAKKLSSKFSSTVLLIIFLFSLWEIEFARFARMYVPFQTLFLWYIFFLYKYLIEDNNKSLKWVFILSFGSILVYEASIFLTVLNFIILFFDRERKAFSIDIPFRGKVSYKLILICITIFAATYAYTKWDARGIGFAELYPPGYIESHSHLFVGHTFHKPLLLITTLTSNIIWSIPFVIVTAITLFSIYKIFKLNEKKFANKLMIALLPVLSLLNLFGLIIILTLIYLLLNWLSLTDAKKKEIRLAVVAVIINLFFWIAFTHSTATWYSMFTDFEANTYTAILKKILIILFNFPNLYYDFLRYLITVPIQSILLVISIPVIVIISSLKEYNSTLNIRFILFILLLNILIVSSIDTVLGETRYSFYLYPFVLLIFLLFLKNITIYLFNEGLKEKFIFITVIIIYLIFSGDFNIKHIINIDSKEYNFRMVYDENKTRHYYPRQDIKTPCDIVNKEAHKNDIVIADEFNIDYYLKKLDYVYLHYNNPNFPILSVNRGKNERWSNAGLIYTNQQLLEKINSSQNNIWFITVYKPELNEIDFKRKFSGYKYYTSIDKKVTIYKIPGGTAFNLSKN